MNVRKIALVAGAGLILAARAGADDASRPLQKGSKPTAEFEKSKEQRSASDAADSKNGAAGAKTVTGQVKDVSKDAVTLQTSAGEQLKLKVDGSTKVTVGGQQRSASELRQGAQVRASFEEKGGEKTAKAIDAGDAKASGAPGASTAAGAAGSSGSAGGSSGPSGSSSGSGRSADEPSGASTSKPSQGEGSTTK